MKNQRAVDLWAAIQHRTVRFAGLCALVLLATACSTAHYPVNPPLSADTGALGYAVMELLQETSFRWYGADRTLFQELDFISAVSGGSLVAGYYAMDPTGFLTNFRPRVLDLDLQSALMAKAISPRSLWLQTSPTFGRGDLLQEVLDERIFSGVTFAALPHRRPMVYINATDMRSGSRFEFSQDQFDHLCSDLNQVPLARAVAASMAVPLLISPVTLWNHQRGCQVPLRPVALPGMATRGDYIHLVDGGLSDNTGIRSALDHMSASGGLLYNNRVSRFRGVRQRVFIVIDAQADAAHPDDDSPNTPGLWRQLRSAVDVPINHYSETSLAQLENAISNWKAEQPSAGIAATSGRDELAAQNFHVIVLSLTSARSAEAAAVRGIPAALRIDAAQIDVIRRFVRHELAASPSWNGLLDALRNQDAAQLPLLEASVF